MWNTISVFLPLYLYPINSSWESVTKSIAQYPALNFQIVIAPNPVNMIPDNNYITNLEILNSYTNVKTLGYVSTNWATRNITLVKSDIDSYASWVKYTAANIGISGIFFDETPSVANSENLGYMSNASLYAKKALQMGRDSVIFNPGVPVNGSWYQIADEVIIFEDSWAEFNLSKVYGVPSHLQERSIYLIHNFTGDSSEQEDLVGDIENFNPRGVFVTTQDDYTSLSRLWPQFCEALNDVDNGDNDGSDNSPYQGNSALL